MQHNQSNIFFTADYIQLYINGKLSKTDMHAFEKALLEDDFLADAVEGYQLQKQSAETASNLSFIVRSVSTTQVSKTTLFFIGSKKWFNVAALCIVIVLASLITYLVVNSNNKQERISKIESANAVTSTIPTTPKINSTTVIDTPKQINQFLNKTITVQKSSTPTKKTVTENDDILPSASNNKDKEDIISMALGLAEESNQVEADKIAKSIIKDTIQPPIAARSSKDAQLAFNTATANNAYEAKHITDQNFETIELGKRKKETINKHIKRDIITGLTDSINPVNGWSAYNDYLNKNMHFLSDTTFDGKTRITALNGNEVELEFLIDKKGNPYNIAVIKSNIADSTKNKKIVNILTTGPKFKVSSKNKNTKAKVLIKY